MGRQFCILPDAITGGALIGTIQFDHALLTAAQRVDDVVKQPHEKPANWHHPVVPTLLHVVEGSHVIWVQNRGLARSVEILPGDRILFLDFESDTLVQPGSHPGHWSQQGSGGLRAEKYLLPEGLDPASLAFVALP